MAANTNTSDERLWIRGQAFWPQLTAKHHEDEGTRSVLVGQLDEESINKLKAINVAGLSVDVKVGAEKNSYKGMHVKVKSKFPVTVLDKDRKTRLDPETLGIGNGSGVLARVKPMKYSHPTAGEGVNLYVDAIVISNLVEYTGGVEDPEAMAATIPAGW